MCIHFWDSAALQKCRDPFRKGGSRAVEGSCVLTDTQSLGRKKTRESLMQSSFVFSHQKCVRSGFSWMRCHSITCGQMISIGFPCCFRKSCFVAILSSRDKTLSWSTPWKKWRKFKKTEAFNLTCCCPHWAGTPWVLLTKVSLLNSPAKETYLPGHWEVRKIRGFLTAEIKVTRFSMLWSPWLWYTLVVTWSQLSKT